jgi:hypothetical protein
MKCCQQLKGEGSFRYGNTSMLTQLNDGSNPVKQGWRRCVRLAAAWDVSRLLCNPDRHYCVQNVTSLKPFMSHINPFHEFPSRLYNIYFNIILPYTWIALTFGNSTFWRQSRIYILTTLHSPFWQVCILHFDDTLHSIFWRQSAFYILTTHYILHSDSSLHLLGRVQCQSVLEGWPLLCTWSPGWSL